MKTNNNKLLIVGAGRHSKVTIDILEQMGQYEIVGIVDMKEGKVFDYSVIGADEDLPSFYSKGITNIFISVGNNKLRKKLFAAAEKIGFNIVAAISPYSHISRYAHVGRGVAIMPGAIINAEANIGDGAIINTNASVDHDCVIGEFTHIAPGTAISGSCNIGSECLLGTGARVIDGISIGSNTIIGAGAAVVCDIPGNTVAVGVPAKKIKEN